MGNAEVRLSLPPGQDADAAELAARIRQLGQPSMRERGVDGARAYLEERSAAGSAGPDVDHVHDATVDVPGRAGVPVRVYRARRRPQAQAGAGLPVVVYFHGGGWVIGSVASSDSFCRRLVHAADCVLVSVGYPLAPEHPYPHAVDSAVAAIAWSAAHAPEWGGDPARLVVLGDSAGGNIATVAVRRLLHHGGPPVARQVLAYPVTAGGQVRAGGHFGADWPLTDDDLNWFSDHYVPDPALRQDPDVALLHADVGDLPPTTLLLAGCDPLVTEGLTYADRLWQAGVRVDLHLYAGQIHGFLTLDPAALPRAEEALGLVANAIRNT
ncbi:alpha/beta hydrolase [Frankia sp. R43]|uniref:alpha/beta hydrolase n=1 Tax=Frankia sp. R43 TaxID=269536 RepID=UPI0006CA0C30|nr:alpha/beta hydrolase [Frankia sp. R43]